MEIRYSILNSSKTIDNIFNYQFRSRQKYYSFVKFKKKKKMNFKDKINSSEDEINFVEKRQIDRIRQGISDRENEDSDMGIARQKT